MRTSLLSCAEAETWKVFCRRVPLSSRTRCQILVIGLH